MAYFTDNNNWYLSKKLCMDPNLTVLAPSGWYAKEGLVRKWSNNQWVTKFEEKYNSSC